MTAWRSLVCAVLAGAAFAAEASAAETSRSDVLPLPGYLVPFKDAGSGLTAVRITKPGKLGQGVKCGAMQCGHRYSSSQAWNADQTLLLLASGCGGLCFLDGKTFQPLFHRPLTRDCEWMPGRPETMICVGDRSIALWNPRTNSEEILFEALEHRKMQFGPGKGNPSRDGTRIAVRASDDAGKLVVFAFDLKDGRKFPDIQLSHLPGDNNYCTISPLGDKIVCYQSVPGGDQHTYIFDLEGKRLQVWQENHRPGHGDFAVDAGGDEYAIGISKSEPDKYKVIKRRLSDGAVVSLMKYGAATHVSMRSTGAQGWAIVSYEGDPQDVAKHPKRAPYARQIVALALDGSGEVIPVAQTNNIKVDYHSETHASASPDGSQVIWSSNWGVPGGPVYDFVTQVPSGLSGRE